jgi:hypothetical protein
MKPATRLGCNQEGRDLGKRWAAPYEPAEGIDGCKEAKLEVGCKRDADWSSLEMVLKVGT